MKRTISDCEATVLASLDAAVKGLPELVAAWCAALVAVAATCCR
uniref:Uncharacterized protein n=1 Tax=Arundo donax TaxID=35708 RepID=A0A0A9H9W1_ARUDO